MPILRADELDIISHSVEQTERLGFRMGKLLQAGDVICLSGDMGSGKTAFTRGIGIGWGAENPVTSPTFNLVHEHRRNGDRVRLYHLDCYRLENARETETIGLDDIFDYNDIVIFEWPERIKEVLPKDRLWVNIITLDQTRRNFVFEGHGKRFAELVAQFQEVTFGA